MNRLPRWTALSLVLVASTLPGLASPTAAGPPLRDDGAGAAAAEPEDLAAACALAPGPIHAQSFIWTPPEELTSMAWRIPAASCAACATASLNPTALTFRMRWTRACSAEAEILIVGGTPGPTCLEPDTSRVLCGPTVHAISSIAAANVLYTFPIPGECCIDEEAFVLVRFRGLGACATTVGPGLAASTAPCVSCQQFVTAAGIFPGTTEWCSVGATLMTWFSLDAECCGPTPALERSWGSIKSIYR